MRILYGQKCYFNVTSQLYHSNITASVTAQTSKNNLSIRWAIRFYVDIYRIKNVRISSLPQNLVFPFLEREMFKCTADILINYVN